MDCININDSEYQTLVAKSGIPEKTVRDYAQYFRDRFDRLPRLDELPDADSSDYIKKTYDVKNDLVNINNLSTKLHTTDINELIVKLNSIYHDKLIDIRPITDEVANIDIFSRPTTNIQEFFPKDYDNIQINVINGMLEDIARYGGLDFKTTNTAEMSKMKDIPNAGLTNAFVKDGTIYINTERMTADSPIHEMLHIFLGGVKYTSPDLYKNLLNTVTNVEEFRVYANNYENRTASDIAEEVLVTLFSKYLTHLNSMFDTINKDVTLELLYQVKRIMDTAIFGDISVRALSNEELFSKSLVDVAKATNSDIIRNNFINIWNFSREHRLLNNLKSSLMKLGVLIERC